MAAQRAKFGEETPVTRQEEARPLPRRDDGFSTPLRPLKFRTASTVFSSFRRNLPIFRARAAYDAFFQGIDITPSRKLSVSLVMAR